MKKVVLASTAILLLAAGVLTLATAVSIARRDEQPAVKTEVLSQEPVHTTTAPAAGWLTEYTLTERTGREFASAELNGQVHVVNFFFASCPSYCRMQTMEVQKLAQEFGPQGVKFLSITVDPERDTPTELARYADLFNADPNHWFFLTGDLLLLRRVGAEMYQLPVDKQMHTEHLVVLDRWGKIRGRIRWKDDPAELVTMKQLLSQLLAEKEPPAETTTPSTGTVAAAAEEDEEAAATPQPESSQPTNSSPSEPNATDDSAVPTTQSDSVTSTPTATPG